eukprot:TRINITY_DN10307_c0_g2_i1.p1 TRINITY_DN10307_c0_g2~~TRINITY_DN10307_c0_g2_i1.p1  ORF type:complete len:391 (+),score=57.02 TRINITY_DN10307_c0_g2_i1:42-1214(+)
MGGAHSTRASDTLRVGDVVISQSSDPDPGPGEGNIYQLFGFELYSSPNDCAVKSRYRKLCDKYHPDKHPGAGDDMKQFYDGAMKLINGAKDEFDRWRRNPLAKKLYDSWLRKRMRAALEAEDSVEPWQKVARWVSICMKAGAGVAMTSCGLAFAASTGGAALALSVGGSAALSASLKAGIGQYKNPDQPVADFMKDVVAGAVAGAACGAVAGAAAPSISVAMEAGNYSLASAYSAGVGSLSSVASRGVEDVAHVCRGSQKLSDVLSLKHAARYAVDATMGAAAGIAAQSISNAAHLPGEATADLYDETAFGARQFFADAGEKLKVDTVGTLVESVRPACQEAYACHEAECALHETGAEGVPKESRKGSKRAAFRTGMRALALNAVIGLIA